MELYEILWNFMEITEIGKEEEKLLKVSLEHSILIDFLLSNVFKLLFLLDKLNGLFYIHDWVFIFVRMLWIHDVSRISMCSL